MNLLGFSNGEYLQRLWFNSGSNTDLNAVDPQLEVVTWNWILAKSSRVEDDYQDFLKRTTEKLNAWLFNSVKRSLVDQVNKMVDEKLVALPTKDSGKQPFGVIDSQIITYKDEKMPKFEKYYFNSEAFDKAIGDLPLHYLFEGVDDFIAAIRALNLHVFAIGSLEYVEGLLSDKINIRVERLGFYVKDNYEFIRGEESLGFWKIIDETTAEVQRNPSNKGGYYQVNNKLYRDYRSQHAAYQEGYNYRIYSDIHYEKVNLTLSFKSVE